MTRGTWIVIAIVAAAFVALVAWGIVEEYREEQAAMAEGRPHDEIPLTGAPDERE